MVKPKPFQFHPILHHHLLFLFLTLHHHHHVTKAQSPVQPVPPLSSPHNTWGWDPSMAIVIGALIISILLVAVFFAFFHRCTESYFAPQGNIEWPCSYSRGGINPEILETFPTLVYSTIKDLRICKAGAAEGPLECAVCLTEFNDDDTLRLIPHCNHVFHPLCIDAWLSSHVTCPVCRANLTQDPGQVAVWLTTTELGGGGKNEAEGSGNRASEQSIGCGSGESEIKRCQVACEGVRSGEEDKGVKEHESKSKLFVKGRVLPRSNTTDHSVVEAEESVERFTLRLPEDVRKYIMLNHGVLMKRSVSYNVVVSSRRGLCWSDSEGGSRGKRNMNMVGVRGQGGSIRGKGRV